MSRSAKRERGRAYFALRGDLWLDNEFSALSDAAKVAYFFAASHRDGTQAGVLRLPAAYIVNDLQWSPDKTENALSELVAAGWLMRSGDWLALPKLMRHDPPYNVDAAIGAARATLRDFDRVPGAVEAAFPILSQRVQEFEPSDRNMNTLASLLAEIERRITESLRVVTLSAQRPDGGDTLSPHIHSHSHIQSQYQDHAQRATETGKTGCFPLPAADAGSKNAVRQEQDDLSLEVARISDPTVSALDSPQMRAAWRADPERSDTYTRFLIRAGVEGHHNPKENIA